MTDKSQQPKDQAGVLSVLNMAIEGLNLAKEVADIIPTKAVFGSVTILVTMIRDIRANDQDYVGLGLSCVAICNALRRGMGEKKLDDLSKPVCDAIAQLRETVVEIQGGVMEQIGRHRIGRFVHSRNDKDVIAKWKSDLDNVHHVFNTELIVPDTLTTVADIRQVMPEIHEDTGGQNQVTQNSAPGELPPPPPRAFFGREGLIDSIVGFAERPKSIALIGARGIGKTSIALAALHDDRIKRRFGQDRRFVRCDKFPATHNHFLRRLSVAIGAGVENPRNLSSLRPFLSSKKMLIILDNAESILDRQGPNGEGIYAVVDELTRFNNICLCITSRISTVPPDCEILEIPTLQKAAAQDIFYRIYRFERSDSESINHILEELDFRPLSITLLATFAWQNHWDTRRLTMEWERTKILHTQHPGSLATTIELSFASPVFQELGPDARELLGVVAFFPQGVNVNKKHTSRLFPTIPNILNMLDTFCAFSVTQRSDEFVTVSAPLRDYLRPKDPASSPLLITTKEHYFTQLSGDIPPGKPGFEEARWIASEDINVEHLLDVFTTIDAGSGDIWDVCAKFMAQLFWHKSRLTTLEPKIRALPDDHPSKAQCLWDLSRLFDSIGNLGESKRLLGHAFKLCKKDTYQAARTLRSLSDTNRRRGLLKEGIRQAHDALIIFEGLRDEVGQAGCLITRAWLLCRNKQLYDAKRAASRALKLLLEKDEQLWTCRGYRVLGEIHRDKGETREAIRHYLTALTIASRLNMDTQQFWIHFSLMLLFSNKRKFGQAQTHIDLATSYAVNDAYLLARAVDQQAQLLVKQHRIEEARTEALRALDAFERLGAAEDMGFTQQLLRRIDARATRRPWLPPMNRTKDGIPKSR